MNQKEKEIIQNVISKADEWMKDCHCAYQFNKKYNKTKYSFCEQYGCSSIDELVEPLRHILGDTPNNNQ